MKQISSEGKLFYTPTPSPKDTPDHKAVEREEEVGGAGRYHEVAAKEERGEEGAGKSKHKEIAEKGMEQKLDVDRNMQEG